MKKYFIRKKGNEDTQYNDIISEYGFKQWQEIKLYFKKLEIDFTAYVTEQ